MGPWYDRRDGSMSIRSRIKKEVPDLYKYYYHKASKSTKMFWFTEELAMRGVISIRDHHTYWGRYYKYPECCIDFFVSLLENEVEYPADFLRDRCPIYRIDDTGYVKCPKCMDKRRHLYE